MPKISKKGPLNAATNKQRRLFDIMQCKPKVEIEYVNKHIMFVKYCKNQ